MATAEIIHLDAPKITASASPAAPGEAPAAPAAETPAPAPDKGLGAFFAALLGRSAPAATTGSLAEQAEAAEEAAKAAALRKLHKQLDAEAQECARQISMLLADYGLCERVPLGKGKFKERRVQFAKKQRWPVTEEALYLPVDLSGGQRPDGVSVQKLKAPEVLEDLSISIGRKVDAKYSETDGFMFVVWRQEGARGIPVHVNYDDMIAGRPANLDKLSFPLGLGEGKKLHWESLRRIQSLVIAGTTGGGKSNMLNVIITSLCASTSPDFFQVALVDWKRSELGRYRDIPHLVKFTGHKDGQEVTKPAFVTQPQETLALFKWLFKEMNRRIKLFEREKALDIKDYNFHHRKDGIGYLYLVIDELALVSLDKEVGKKCMAYLVKLASVGRAFGMGVIACTQYPNSRVLDTLVKAVMPATISFRLPTIPASVTVLGDKSAFNLETTGRMMYQFGGHSIEIQAPFLPKEKSQEILGLAAKGKGYTPDRVTRHDVGDDEIFQWADRERQGFCTIEAMAQNFGPRGFSRRDATLFIDRWANKEININGAAYTLRVEYGKASRLLPLETMEAPTE